VRLVPTEQPLHAAELARAAATEADLVVVAGGDGTINEVVNGMVGSETPMAVLPCGTANVLACETGIPCDPVAAASALPGWRARRIGVGLVRPTGAPARHFLLMVGVGLDAEVLQHVNHNWKDRVGKLAYWAAGLSMAVRPLPRLRVVGPEAVETSFALASRVRNYGGDLAIAAGAHLFRDDFELVTFQGRTSLPYMAYLGAAVVGQAARLPGVEVTGVRRVRCEPVGGRVGVQADGEPVGELPAEIELVPSALTMLLPEAYASRAKAFSANGATPSR
jgi:diacylglycerol kinase family enzyme